MTEVYISSKKLIETLGIKEQELIDIERFFDADPDDEWELQEGKDYRIVNKSSGLREYTSTGAYTIAKYLETNKKESFWDKLKEWFSHTKQKVRQAFIREKILDNCSSLVKRNGLLFISSVDAVAIFSTRPDYLRKIAQEAQKVADPSRRPLIKGEDFDDFGDGRGIYYSLSGIGKLALVFKDNLTQKNRREWCTDVGDVIQPQIDDIVKRIIQRDKDIQKAMQATKKRDKQQCRVSSQKKTKISSLQLAAHHLYSQAQYPHLAVAEANLITLSQEVHEQFHQHYMGGAQKPCTIDDFIAFVQVYYPENTDLIVWLKEQKLVLGNPEPVNTRKPHVLYLPAKQVS
jgi:hypothetical protein